jgi:hypothetical protein
MVMKTEELRLLVNYREIALMASHGGDQDLLRHRKEALVEGAGTALRILDEKSHLIEQSLVRQELTSGGLRHPVSFAPDDLFSAQDPG